jgi:hypothetical protein
MVSISSSFIFIRPPGAKELPAGNRGNPRPSNWRLQPYDSNDEVD